MNKFYYNGRWAKDYSKSFPGLTKGNDMKNPGPIKAGTQDHIDLINYAKVLAARFEMAEPAALGLLARFNEKICEAVETDMGMASLKIEVID